MQSETIEDFEPQNWEGIPWLPSYTQNDEVSPTNNLQIPSYTRNDEVSATGNLQTTFQASFQSHLLSCKLHEDENLKICFGTLRRSKKFQCVKKAAFCHPNMMPTCGLHRDQLKRAAYCKVPLLCGVECGRVCEWKPHSFHRCPSHYDFPMPCYLLKIPLELRTRIYDLLLPNQDIPAQFRSTFELRSDSENSYLAILRVNRQIHDEATSLMYSTNTFTIQLSNFGLSMCNNQSKNPTPPYPGGNHALQDYQMQLMLLEQQNKKRNLMARQQMQVQQQTQLQQQVQAQRQAQAQQMQVQLQQIQAQRHAQAQQMQARQQMQMQQQMQAGPSIPGNNPTHAQPAASPICFTPLAYMTAPSPPSMGQPYGNMPPMYPEFPISSDPVWSPSLSSRYFNLIQCFRIEIRFPFSTPKSSHPASIPIPVSFEQNHQIRTQRLYEFSDHLHRLISRLQLTGCRINRLEIAFEIGETYQDLDEAFSAMELLLRPTRRLCNIGTAEVNSITMTRYVRSYGNPEVSYLVNILSPEFTSSKDRNENLIEYLQTWSRALSGSTPSLPPTAVFEGYWRLESLLSTMRYHCNHPAAQDNPDLRSGFQHFADLRHRARVAREDEDVKGFKEIFGAVLATWQRYLDWEKEFQLNAWKDVECILDVVADDEGRVV